MVIEAERADVPDIVEAVRDHLLRSYRVFPVHANRASALGHPCIRYLTYLRTRWAEASRPDPVLLSIFREGNLHERAVIDLMRDARFEVVEQQKTIDWKEHTITGSIDGQIVMSGGAGGTRRLVPFDVKSCSSYTFRSLDTLNDVIHHKYHYVRAWRSQMVIYCLLNEKEYGLLILKDKSTGRLHQITVPLDYQHGEELVQKADAVNAHVKAETLPDRIPYDEDVCGRCAFADICLPDEILKSEARLIDAPEIATKLQRRAELRKVADEYVRLDREIKELAHGWGDGETVIGVEWLIRTKTFTQHHKARAERDIEIQRVEVHRLSRDAEAAHGAEE